MTASLRTEFLVNCIVSVGRNVLLVGEQGSAKTKLVNCFLKQYKTENILVMHSNFSSTTTPQLFQKSVEGNVDRRMGSVFGPPVGKKIVKIFLFLIVKIFLFLIVKIFLFL